MKKLMMFAAAVTIVGSAFASLDVLDYKATVSHAYLKSMKVKVTSDKLSTTLTLPVKYKASSSLVGYVITQCRNCDEGGGIGYLVLANSKIEDRTVGKIPAILPVDLLVRVWASNGSPASKSWLAEGYLFAGAGKQAYAGVNADYTVGADADATSGVAGGFSFLDYGNSTALLFGKYNRPSDAGDFADAWLDAAGFGKAAFVSTSGDLCEEGSTCLLLDSLSGSVIGGLYLCAESGYNADYFLCTPWLATTDVVSGTWSVKRTTKLSPIAPEADYANTLGDSEFDAYVNAAIKKLNSKFMFDDVVPSTSEGPDFPRIVPTI